jgi:nucleoside-diphosphate-sugar epimerase
MRILVTGASGYIGLHLVRELLAGGHVVTAVVRSPAKLGPFAQNPGLRIVTTDLEQRNTVAQALKGQDVCVHLALLWGEIGTELEMRDIAVAAKLFDDAGQAGVKRCMFMSSAAVHRPFSLEMSEEDRLTTADYYGANKAAGELFLRAACAAHKMTGIVIRPGPVVGPPAFAGASFRSDHRIADMVSAAMRACLLEVPGGDGRQLCDVTTLAKLVHTLADLENPHPTYICVDSEVYSWEWIARQVVTCMNSASEVRTLPSKQAVIPHFRPTLIEELLGGPIDSRNALIAHIHHLAQGSR